MIGRANIRRATIDQILSSERCKVERPSHLTPSIMDPETGRWTFGDWRQSDWTEINEVPWSAVNPDKRGGWIVPAAMQWGDYSGSTCDRANHESWCEDFASSARRADGKPNWIRVYGSHGSHGIAISISWLLSDDGADAWETLCALSDYPLISDEQLSDLEMRLESEAWETYGWFELRRALAKAAEEGEREDLSDAIDDDDLPWERVLSNAIYDQTWSKEHGYASALHAAWERHSPYCEAADSCVLPIDEWVEDLSIDDIAALVTSAREMVNAWMERGAYACLGCRETSAKGKHGTQERLCNSGDHECHYPGCPDQTRPGLAKTDYQPEIDPNLATETSTEIAIVNVGTVSQ